MPFPPLAPRLCMGGHLHISPRHLLGQVIEAGATHVYLEKPGAPSVARLRPQIITCVRELAALERCKAYGPGRAG